jgi:Ca2+-binding RTX toxin-like protein
MSHHTFSTSEQLESRLLLSSASLSKGVLHIQGDTATANDITVRRTADNQVAVSFNDGEEQLFGDCDQITKVLIDGGAEDDTLAIDEDERTLNLVVEMNGRAGDDTLLGSAGDDFLKGQVGDDSISGEDGSDRMFGQVGDDQLFGGDGSDMMKGSAGDDRLLGGDGNDRMWGSEGNDSVEGESGNDVMFGGPRGDTMFGGDGNDTFRGGDPRDQMDGGAGKNKIFKK